jgi:UPF0755 protein
MIWRRILILVLFFGCIFVSSALFWQNFLDSPLKITEPTLFVVAPGSSIEKVATNLQLKGYTRYPMLVILLARWQGTDKQLKKGEYELKPGTTPVQFLDKVSKGKVFLRHYTLVEGWTLKQVFATLANNPYLQHTINTTDLALLSKQVGMNQSNLEGYLNPDTYLFARGVADTIIVKKAYLKMQNNLNKYWATRDSNVPFTSPYEALVAASLIEKETARPDERAKIAGVITRRLQQHMRLQIDASVIYGLGSQYQGKLTRNDLKIDSPYNTYLHDGLPPTPIAMPSVSSLIAALHPAAGSELYYVARGDGSHEFTSTLADHIAAIKKYHVQILFPEAKLPENSLPQSNLNQTFESLYPRSNWDEQIIGQSLLESQKEVTTTAIVKHNNRKTKTVPIAKKVSTKVIHRSKKHESQNSKGNIHHH